MNTTLLQIDRVTCSFDGLRVLDGVDLSVQAGEIVSLFGANGSGKSTLFNILTGFQAASGGTMRFRDRDLHSLSPVNIARLGIGRTWQTPRVFKDLSALDNLMLAAKNAPGESWLNLLVQPTIVRASEVALRDRGMQLLRDVRLAEQAGSTAGALSFGQQKLLNIAMLWMNNAELFVMDEPFAGVAPSMVDHVAEVLLNLRANGHSILLVDHNTTIATSISNATYLLRDGRLVANVA